MRSVATALDDVDAVVPVIQSADPLFEVCDGKVQRVLERSRVLRGQSPQGFQSELLRTALSRAGDARGKFATLYEVVLKYCEGAEIAVVEGELDNIKVTQPIDRHLAMTYLGRRDE